MSSLSAADLLVGCVAFKLPAPENAKTPNSQKQQSQGSARKTKESKIKQHDER